MHSTTTTDPTWWIDFENVLDVSDVPAEHREVACHEHALREAVDRAPQVWAEPREVTYVLPAPTTISAHMGFVGQRLNPLARFVVTYEKKFGEHLAYAGLAYGADPMALPEFYVIAVVTPDEAAVTRLESRMAAAFPQMQIA